jgi:hypothetical protein
MISVSECAAHAGLASNELVLGAIPSAKHRSLLDSYLLSSHRGLDTVRDMIVADLRGFLDLGAPTGAADMLIVLRMLFTEHPQTITRTTKFATSRPFATLDAGIVAHYGAYRGDEGRDRGVVITFSRGARSARGGDDTRDRIEFNEALIGRRGARLFRLRGEH